jgi:[acyl-carrier-protein] S-malonyltransferase
VANGKTAFVFPGQGSQYVGMGKDLCEQFTVAKRIFAEADEALGFALSKLCFDGPDVELKRTENTQPAILAVSIAAVRVLEAETPLRAHLVAGHSLGEYTALIYAGAFEFADAVKVVRQRGRFMQEAVPQGEGAMAVVLGLAMDAVRDLCREASAGEIVAPANYNGGGQIVIAGTRSAVARAASLAKDKGAKRVLDIPVSAPFHCELMRPAAERLREVLAPVTVHPLTVGVITNVEAQVNQDISRVKSLLTDQAVLPVRWEETVRTLERLGCRRVLEVGPGKVLTGLVKRISASMLADSFGAAADLHGVVREATA